MNKNYEYIHKYTHIYTSAYIYIYNVCLDIYVFMARSSIDERSFVHVFLWIIYVYI